ncbi:MAG: hypothetical protein JKY48_09595, partial [Flavobacteriales bacterium]|nr:hypothetical protein [Flavobacteriales bacterium]
SCGGGAAPSSDIQIDIDLDEYENETTWTLVDPQGTTVLSGGTYAGGDELISVSTTTTLAGRWVFTINDTFGDGLIEHGGSDANGTSSYTLTLDGVVSYTSGNSPNYGAGESRNIDVGLGLTYTGSVTSQTGVGNNGNVTGSPDGANAQWHTNGDIMVLDMGSIFPAGTQYVVVWRKRNGGESATLVLEESTDNSSYNTHSTPPTTTITTSVTSTVTSENSFRYLRISKAVNPDWQIDAIGIVPPAGCDTDNDGINDQFDLDSDGDGIADIVEAGGVDADGNGIVDGVFTDTDGDGWSNTFDSDNGGTALTDPDTDSDGFENSIDIDADDDGIIDIIESQPSGALISPSGTDSDGDGIDDNFDLNQGNALTTPENTDGTDNPDYTDTDSDNDGDLDAVEGWDTNNTGIANTTPAGSDADGDGLDDNYDTVVGPNATTNVTNGGQSSVSFPNLDRGATAELDWREDKDYDEDGVPDDIDIDDDNDGILDVDEGYCVASVLNGGLETPAQGCASYSIVDDALVSGWSHSGTRGGRINCGAGAGGSVSNVELWGSGFLGVASDEGVQFAEINAYAAGTMSQTFTLPAAGTYILEWGISHRGRSGIDSMSIRIDEGANSLVDSIVGAPTGTWSRHAGTTTFTTTGTTVVFGLEAVFASGGSSVGNFIDNVIVCVSTDTDGDGVADYLDRDSDNDGVPDIVEAGGVDSDNDGVVDGVFVDGVNVDGWSNVFDVADGGAALIDGDTDMDGQNNRVDLDSDNDGIADLVEAGGTDANGDGIGDVTTDVDGDGWFNTFDSDNGGTALADADTDGDGFENRIDIDADGDGIVDLIESQASTGTPIVPSGTDSDGDGIDDNFDTDSGNSLTTPENTDGTDNPDYTDTNSDNDNNTDLLEAWDSDNDGDIDTFPAGTDSDNDGLDDNFDDIVGPNLVTNSTNAGQTSFSFPNFDDALTSERDWRETEDNDNDGIIDAFDLDDDNDGILDSDERNCTSGYGSTVTFDNGVASASNALGLPDGNVATIANGDILTIDLIDVIPVGQNIRIRMARTNANRLLVESSSSSGSGFGNGVTYGNTAVDVDMPVVSQFYSFDYLVSGAAIRYLRFTRELGAMNLDGMSYAPQCAVLDTDGDGIEDYLELDSDNDGIPDIAEAGGEDTDGNGLVDNILANGVLTSDTDADGWADLYDTDNGGTAIPNPDTDNDGINDSQDLDSDNDGIPDVVEVGGTDVNGDGRADDYVDTDADGFNDVVDGDVGQDGTSENTANALVATGTDTDNDGVPNSIPSADNDGDGIRNHLDLDSDNDGIADVVEAGGTDVNGDGRADDYVDADADGFNDVVDGDPTNALVTGSDASGANTSDALTLTGADTDNDGVPNSRPNDDLDGDGVFNYLDLDSDDDGILDITEAGGTDTDTDGREDSFVDVDNDGFNDNVDGDPNNSLAAGNDATDSNLGGVTIATGDDTDADGTPNSYPNDDFDEDNLYNFIDIDADNDGITDNTEGQGTATYIIPANADADGDGIDDAYDADDVNFGGAGSGYTLSDIDAVSEPNTPDYLDLDSDFDGIPDNIEGHDSDGNRSADVGSPANSGVSGGTTDADGDGLYDGWDNNNASSDPTNTNLQGASHPNVGNTGTAERDWREITDSDNDGIADDFDLDNDNDGIPDLEELDCTSGNADAVTSNVGVLNAANALGTFNSTTAQINSGDVLVLDLTDVVLEGEFVRIRMQRGNDNRILVEGSTDNISYTNPVTYGNLSSDLDMPLVSTNYYFLYPIGSGGARYIRFTREAGETLLDAVAYSPQCTDRDSDGDGIEDQYDLDSDNDGIPDIVEAGGEDTDGNGLVDDINVNGTLTADTDENGLADLYDVNNSGTAISNPDTDNDGINDSQDLDADNDGIADVVEAGGTDVNGY